ncbi:MAG: hypothetical protein UV23_C0041G0005 [Candidatus Nomurabacteria bacterium GW2011_GWF1_42_40]|nr:MAG: hypothetical protein UV23_C0041G0005 [Candidatus Nomurabacteria bacterium GW2011_GWF1_42_40]
MAIYYVDNPHTYFGIVLLVRSDKVRTIPR